MTLQEFLARLHGVKGSGESFTAKCPAHEDHENSLSVRGADGGKILLNCHAGCKSADILAALGLRFMDIMGPPSQTQRRYTRSSIVATYDYTDADGNLLYQVVRHEPKKFTQRRPDGSGHWVYGLSRDKYEQAKSGDWYRSKTGEGQEFPTVDRVLYRLPAILAAIQSGKKIFIVEGEKDADNLAALGFQATTNAGGAAKWARSFTATLRDATCIILPDNDPPGQQHAELIKAQLPNAVILNLPGLPPKGDVSDWIAAGGTREALIALTRRALADQDAATPDASTATVADSPFRVLGYSTGHFYFLSGRSGQIVDLTPASLKKLQLLELAPLNWWELNYGSAEGPAWTVAANALIQQCLDAGLFTPDLRRGRGAWWDAGRTVLHHGDQLIVDGQQTGLLEIDSRFVYERAQRLRIPHTQPLTSDQGKLLSDLCTSCSWEHPYAGALLAGWVAIAPICGVLRWRPHIWITGPSGAGKSWIMTNIVSGLLGDIALRVQSVSTEAGVRQSLGTDARPVLYDEAEMEDHAGQLRMQRILELARQASSEGGSVIAKGTAHGQAQHYMIRSMFCLSSIGVGVKRRADETRVTVLSLSRPPAGKTGQDRFARIQASAERVCTPEYSSALIARSCGLVQQIRAAAETFAIAIASTSGTRRAGDQLGALLAGAWSLWSDTEPTLEQAVDYVSTMGLASLTPSEEGRDELACLTHLLEQRVRVEVSDRAAVERTIGELVEAAEDGVNMPSVTAANTLERHGLKWHKDGLVISMTHSGVAGLLRDTPWATGWGTFLRRVDGAIYENKAFKFAGAVTKGVVIPWGILAHDTNATYAEEAPF